jgi:hypothetical protein
MIFSVCWILTHSTRIYFFGVFSFSSLIASIITSRSEVKIYFVAEKEKMLFDLLVANIFEVCNKSLLNYGEKISHCKIKIIYKILLVYLIKKFSFKFKCIHVPVQPTSLSFRDRKENTLEVVTEKMKSTRKYSIIITEHWFMRIFKVDVTRRCDFPHTIITIDDVLM